MPRNAIRRSTRIAEALPTGAVPPPPPKKRKRIRRRPSTPPQPAPDPAAEERYGNTVDPAAVTRPIKNLVHPSLSHGWMVSSDLSMCFIFDAVSPARRFKCGTLATPDGDFANYGRKPYMDLTETDGPPPGWVQYKPPIIVYVVDHTRSSTAALTLETTLSQPTEPARMLDNLREVYDMGTR